MAPVGVAVAPVGEQDLQSIQTGPLQQVRGVVDLGHGHAAVEVGPHVLGLGRWGAVGVAADVAVEVVIGKLFDGDDSGEAVDVGEAAVGGGDLLLVAGAQVVLSPALAVVAVGVDEQHPAPPLRRFGALGPQDQNGGGDAGAVEQVRAQADDGVEQVVVDDAAADLALGAAAEQHAVGHDGGHDAVGLEYGQHVLQEHQVGFLAALGV